MVSKGLLACIASVAIVSNSLADNVHNSEYEISSGTEIRTVSSESQYDYKIMSYILGTLFGGVGLIGTISLATKYIPRLINRNREELRLVSTLPHYHFNPNLRINLGDGHFHG